MNKLLKLESEHKLHSNNYKKYKIRRIRNNKGYKKEIIN